MRRYGNSRRGAPAVAPSRAGRCRGDNRSRVLSCKGLDWRRRREQPGRAASFPRPAATLHTDVRERDRTWTGAAVSGHWQSRDRHRRLLEGICLDLSQAGGVVGGWGGFWEKPGEPQKNLRSIRWGRKRPGG